MEKQTSIVNRDHQNKAANGLHAGEFCFFKPFIQPKLSINEPGDPYEKEADETAEKVMRMHESNALHQPTFFRPVLNIQRKCKGCEEEEQLHRKETSAEVTASPSTEKYIGTLSGGRPLNEHEKSFFEPRFGHNFSDVRLHTDSEANQSAKDINALAYTHGSNIVFAPGQYRPETDAGKQLMAHELTHVIQQNNSLQPKFIQRKVIVDPPSEAAYVAGLLNFLCNGAGVTSSGDTIISNCSASSNESCACVCDVTSDPARTYNIHVKPQSRNPENKELWDRSTTVVPIITPTPVTNPGANPDITINTSTGVLTEYGVFDSSGRPFTIPDWRILGHELCGHGRLNQSYAGGPGNRQQHDATIDTENTIASEHGSGLMRGHFFDPKPPGRQGESFYRGDGSKLVFYQTDGLHYEAP